MFLQREQYSIRIMWTQGLHYCLLISFSSCLTVDYCPGTPVQDESLTLICSLSNKDGESVYWQLFKGGTRYSNDCNLNVDAIGNIGDDPTNYNVTCDIQPNISYQFNLTIYRLQKQHQQVTWECFHLYDGKQLNFTLLVRANQPLWRPGAADYREGQLYNLTCSTNVADPVPSFSWWIVGPNNISSELAGAAYGWQNETGIHNTIAFLPNRTLGVVDIWCKVNQSQLGELDSDRHRINVIYTPKQAVTDASDVLGYVGGTVTMNCSVPDEDLGNPEGHWFEWRRASNDTVDDNNGADGHLVLDLTSVDFDDVYTCTPTNAAGRGEPASINLTVLATPKLNSELESNTDIHYNATLALSCKCTSRPKSVVFWSGYVDSIFRQTSQQDSEQGDRIKMTQSEVLLEWHTDILEERKHGSGRVTCQCVNSAGENETDTEINVQYPPTQASVRSSHEDLIVVDEQTKTVIVSCQVSEENRGNPPIYNYTWTHLRNGEIPGEDPTAQNLTLSVNRNNLCLDDEYTCTAANILGEAESDAFNVTLAVAPELEQPIDIHYDVRYDNDSFALKCRYNAKPEARVLWRDFNDEVFEAIDLATQPNGDCNLMVYSTQRLQWRNNTSLVQRKAGSGFVTCVADNGVGGEHTENITINVQYGPGAPALRFTNNVVYANGTAAMTCSFTPGLDGTDGNPTVTECTWLFGNDTLDYNDNSHVTFAVTSVTQEGEYRCYGTNHPVGGSIRGDASQPEYLTVNVYPYLVQPNESYDDVIVLYNDQNTSLSCLGAGKPEIDFNWYHNGDQVDEEDFIEEKDVEAGKYLYDLQYGWRSNLMRAVGGAYFTCDNITKYDGHYQCEAYIDEEVSNMSAPVRLITHYPAHWAGPVLHPTHYTSPGDNFTLLCDVCMKPRGNITWYMNGEPVRDNVSITDDGRNLTLTDVLLEDFGNYTCQVINIILNENYTESFDISLVERGAPHMPQAFQVDDSTSRSLNVSWQPGSTGGYDSQTFTLCYVIHHINQKCERINDLGGSDAISKSLCDLKANTTYQLQLYAENAHHDNNRSSLTAMNHSTKVAPVIKVVDLTFSATRVTVTWVVEAGEPSHLTLVHCPTEECDVTTQRSRRDVKPTWRELATNIPPDGESYTYKAQEGEPFDVYSRNRFNLWAYEPGLNDRSNTDDDDAIWDVLPLSPGVDIGLVVGIVLAVAAAAALATSGFVYYRKKATKGPSHREIGQDNLGMSPEGVGNPGYDDNDDIEPYGEVSFNVPPQSKPAASSSDPPSEVVEYAQEVKPKKKAKAAAEASAVYAMVDKTQKKTKTQGSVPEDETQDPYENVDFPKNKIEYLDKEPYYLSKDGLIYVNLLKKGPEVIHETAYEPSDYKTIDWVRTAQINKHPRPPTPPDTPPPRAEKYDDEEDIFGPLPFQAKEEEEQDGDFDEENVDYEDDGTRPTNAPVTASMTQHSRREQVPEGAVGGVADHEMDSGHSSPRGQFLSST